MIVSIGRKLTGQEPTTGSVRLASVAVILRDADDPKTLMIRRAERREDPWSGQVAFPGGKKQEEDKTIRDVAIRETREEVGIDLASSARFLGYFGMFRTHTGSMDVIPSVFLLESDVKPRLNEEATSCRWIAYSELVNPVSRSSHSIRRDGTTLEMPAFAVSGYLIWGLTYRIVSTLFLEGS